MKNRIECKCTNCNKPFSKRLSQYKRTKNHFCSRSCSTTYNNKNVSRNKQGVKGSVIIVKRYCSICNKILNHRQKYCCSTKCSKQHRRNIVYNKIELGESIKYLGNFETQARWLKKYLISKYGDKCMECGWNKENPTTKKTPIQINHKNGDSTDNKKENGELLCPNCHSLTSNFGALNKGNGRLKRKEYRTKQKENLGYYL